MANITLADLLKKAIDVEIIGKIHTMLPGKIIKYDASKQKADVKPLIKKTYLDGTINEMPIITNVPIIFPRSGGASLTFPVNVGDTAALFFAERALERWLILGGEVEAGASRKYSLTDCIAIMGLFPFTENSLGTATDVVLRYNNAQITINNDNKFAIANEAEELISLLIDFVNVIKALTVGGQPIDPPGITALTTIVTRLNTLKGIKV